MTYCWRCKHCGASQETQTRDAGDILQVCCDDPYIIRDYRAEGVSVDAAVGSIRRDFATTDKANKHVRDILPSGDDFLKKHKGDRRRANQDIRDWNARHEPADAKGNSYRPQEV